MNVLATASRPTVSIVDDDISIREALPDLLCELGYNARSFASAVEFLTSGELATTDCLILDVGMPGMSGPELQLELNARGHEPEIIFITARPDEAMRRELLARGAADYLSKPFSAQALRSALLKAIHHPVPGRG